MNTRVLERLRGVEMFAGLTDAQLARVAGMCQAARVAADATIFREGDDGAELYVVLEGSVQVMINTRRPDGSTALSTINALRSGQCFGETALLSHAQRSATVVAPSQRRCWCCASQISGRCARPTRRSATA